MAEYKFVNKNNQIIIRTDYDNNATIYDAKTGAFLCALNLPNLNSVVNPTYLFISGDHIIVNYFDDNVIIKYNTAAAPDLSTLSADLSRLCELNLGPPFETMIINQFKVLDFDKQYGRPLLLTYDDNSLYTMNNGKFTRMTASSAAFKHYKAYEKNSKDHLVTIDCDNLELYYIHSRTDISDEVSL